MVALTNYDIQFGPQQMKIEPDESKLTNRRQVSDHFPVGFMVIIIDIETAATRLKKKNGQIERFEYLRWNRSRFLRITFVVFCIWILKNF
jgi:hypothetical protein